MATGDPDRVWIPEYGWLTPVTTPAGIGAVAAAAGVTTANPLAVWFGVAIVALGVLAGAFWVIGRVLNDWPLEVQSADAGRRELDERRPGRADYRRALAALFGGGALFSGGLLPLWFVGRAVRRETPGLGLPDEFAWIAALGLFATAVLALFVGARTVGRGIDRLAVELAREIAYRRQVG